MKIVSSGILCRKGELPICKIGTILNQPHIILQSKDYISGVTILLESFQDLTNFKNSILQAYESFLKNKENV